MKENNKKIIIIGILIILSIILIFISLNNFYCDENIIAQEVYLYNAWDFFQGKAIIICESGNLYKADLEKIGDYYKIKNMSEKQINDYVIKYGEKYKDIVTSQEIEKIKNESTKLHEELREISNGIYLADSGTTTIKVYNSNKKEFVILSIRGGTQKENTSSNTQELKRIIQDIIYRTDK